METCSDNLVILTAWRDTKRSGYERASDEVGEYDTGRPVRDALSALPCR